MIYGEWKRDFCKKGWFEKKEAMVEAFIEWLREFVDTPASSQLNQSILAPSPPFFSGTPMLPTLIVNFGLHGAPERKERENKVRVRALKGEKLCRKAMLHTAKSQTCWWAGDMVSFHSYTSYTSQHFIMLCGKTGHNIIHGHNIEIQELFTLLLGESTSSYSELCKTHCTACTNITFIASD